MLFCVGEFSEESSDDDMGYAELVKDGQTVYFAGVRT